MIESPGAEVHSSSTQPLFAEALKEIISTNKPLEYKLIPQGTYRSPGSEDIEAFKKGYVVTRRLGEKKIETAGLSDYVKNHSLDLVRMVVESQLQAFDSPKDKKTMLNERQDYWDSLGIEVSLKKNGGLKVEEKVSSSENKFDLAIEKQERLRYRLVMIVANLSSDVKAAYGTTESVAFNGKKGRDEAALDILGRITGGDSPFSHLTLQDGKDLPLALLLQSLRQATGETHVDLISAQKLKMEDELERSLQEAELLSHRFARPLVTGKEAWNIPSVVSTVLTPDFKSFGQELLEKRPVIKLNKKDEPEKGARPEHRVVLDRVSAEYADIYLPTSFLVQEQKMVLQAEWLRGDMKGEPLSVQKKMNEDVNEITYLVNGFRQMMTLALMDKRGVDLQKYFGDSDGMVKYLAELRKKPFYNEWQNQLVERENALRKEPQSTVLGNIQSKLLNDFIQLVASNSPKKEQHAQTIVRLLDEVDYEKVLDETLDKMKLLSKGFTEDDAIAVSAYFEKCRFLHEREMTADEKLSKGWITKIEKDAKTGRPIDDGDFAAAKLTLYDRQTQDLNLYKDPVTKGLVNMFQLGAEELIPEDQRYEEGYVIRVATGKDGKTELRRDQVSGPRNQPKIEVKMDPERFLQFVEIDKAKVPTILETSGDSSEGPRHLDFTQTDSRAALTKAAAVPTIPTAPTPTLVTPEVANVAGAASAEASQEPVEPVGRSVTPQPAEPKPVVQGEQIPTPLTEPGSKATAEVDLVVELSLDNKADQIITEALRRRKIDNVPEGETPADILYKLHQNQREGDTPTLYNVDAALAIFKSEPKEFERLYGSLSAGKDDEPEIRKRLAMNLSRKLMERHLDFQKVVNERVNGLVKQKLLEIVDIDKNLVTDELLKLCESIVLLKGINIVLLKGLNGPNSLNDKQQTILDQYKKIWNQENLTFSRDALFSELLEKTNNAQVYEVLKSKLIGAYATIPTAAAPTPIDKTLLSEKAKLEIAKFTQQVREADPTLPHSANADKDKQTLQVLLRMKAYQDLDLLLDKVVKDLVTETANQFTLDRFEEILVKITNSLSREPNLKKSKWSESPEFTEKNKIAAREVVLDYLQSRYIYELANQSTDEAFYDFARESVDKMETNQPNSEEAEKYQAILDKLRNQFIRSLQQQAASGQEKQAQVRLKAYDDINFFVALPIDENALNFKNIAELTSPPQTPSPTPSAPAPTPALKTQAEATTTGEALRVSDADKLKQHFIEKFVGADQNKDLIQLAERYDELQEIYYENALQATLWQVGTDVNVSVLPAGTYGLKQELAVVLSDHAKKLLVETPYPHNMSIGERIRNARPNQENDTIESIRDFFKAESRSRLVGEFTVEALKNLHIRESDLNATQDQTIKERITQLLQTIPEDLQDRYEYAHAIIAFSKDADQKQRAVVAIMKKLGIEPPKPPPGSAPAPNVPSPPDPSPASQSSSTDVPSSQTVPQATSADSVQVIPDIQMGDEGPVASAESNASASEKHAGTGKTPEDLLPQAQEIIKLLESDDLKSAFEMLTLDPRDAANITVEVTREEPKEGEKEGKVVKKVTINSITYSIAADKSSYPLETIVSELTKKHEGIGINIRSLSVSTESGSHITLMANQGTIRVDKLDILKSPIAFGIYPDANSTISQLVLQKYATAYFTGSDQVNNIPLKIDSIVLGDRASLQIDQRLLMNSVGQRFTFATAQHARLMTMNGMGTNVREIAGFTGSGVYEVVKIDDGYGFKKLEVKTTETATTIETSQTVLSELASFTRSSEENLATAKAVLGIIDTTKVSDAVLELAGWIAEDSNFDLDKTNVVVGGVTPEERRQKLIQQLSENVATNALLQFYGETETSFLENDEKQRLLIGLSQEFAKAYEELDRLRAQETENKLDITAKNRMGDEGASAAVEPTEATTREPERHAEIKVSDETLRPQTLEIRALIESDELKLAFEAIELNPRDAENITVEVTRVEPKEGEKEGKVAKKITIDKISFLPNYEKVADLNRLLATITINEIGVDIKELKTTWEDGFSNLNLINSDTQQIRIDSLKPEGNLILLTSENVQIERIVVKGGKVLVLRNSAKLPVKNIILESESKLVFNDVGLLQNAAETQTYFNIESHGNIKIRRLESGNWVDFEGYSGSGTYKVVKEGETFKLQKLEPVVAEAQTMTETKNETVLPEYRRVNIDNFFRKPIYSDGIVHLYGVVGTTRHDDHSIYDGSFVDIQHLTASETHLSIGNHIMGRAPGIAYIEINDSKDEYPVLLDSVGSSVHIIDNRKRLVFTDYSIFSSAFVVANTSTKPYDIESSLNDQIAIFRPKDGQQTVIEALRIPSYTRATNEIVYFLQSDLPDNSQLQSLFDNLSESNTKAVGYQLVEIKGKQLLVIEGKNDSGKTAKAIFERKRWIETDETETKTPVDKLVYVDWIHPTDEKVYERIAGKLHIKPEGLKPAIESAFAKMKLAEVEASKTPENTLTTYDRPDVENKFLALNDGGFHTFGVVDVGNNLFSISQGTEADINSLTTSQYDLTIIEGASRVCIANVKNAYLQVVGNSSADIGSRYPSIKLTNEIQTRPDYSSVYMRSGASSGEDSVMINLNSHFAIIVPSEKLRSTAKLRFGAKDEVVYSLVSDLPHDSELKSLFADIPGSNKASRGNYRLLEIEGKQLYIVEAENDKKEIVQTIFERKHWMETDEQGQKTETDKLVYVDWIHSEDTSTYERIAGKLHIAEMNTVKTALESPAVTEEAPVIVTSKIPTVKKINDLLDSDQIVKRLGYIGGINKSTFVVEDGQVTLPEFIFFRTPSTQKHLSTFTQELADQGVQFKITKMSIKPTLEYDPYIEDYLDMDHFEVQNLAVWRSAVHLQDPHVQNLTLKPNTRLSLQATNQSENIHIDNIVLATDSSVNFNYAFLAKMEGKTITFAGDTDTAIIDFAAARNQVLHRDKNGFTGAGTYKIVKNEEFEFILHLERTNETEVKAETANLPTSDFPTDSSTTKAEMKKPKLPTRVELDPDKGDLFEQIAGKIKEHENFPIVLELRGADAIKAFFSEQIKSQLQNPNTLKAINERLKGKVELLNLSLTDKKGVEPLKLVINGGKVYITIAAKLAVKNGLTINDDNFKINLILGNEPLILEDLNVNPSKWALKAFSGAITDNLKNEFGPKIDRPQQSLPDLNKALQESSASIDTMTPFRLDGDTLRTQITGHRTEVGLLPAFQKVETAFEALNALHERGEINDFTFEEELKESPYKVNYSGRWWTIGAMTGKWFYYDGTKWIESTPPTT